MKKNNTKQVTIMGMNLAKNIFQLHGIKYPVWVDQNSYVVICA